MNKKSNFSTFCQIYVSVVVFQGDSEFSLIFGIFDHFRPQIFQKIWKISTKGDFSTRNLRKIDVPKFCGDADFLHVFHIFDQKDPKNDPKNDQK